MDKIINIFKQLINQYKSNSEPTTKYKIIAFNNAIKALQKVKSLSELEKYPGIGKGIKSRINEILETGTLKELKTNTIDTSNIRSELTNIIGIGEKKADELINKFKIVSIQDLKQKIKKKIITPNELLKLGIKVHKKYESKIKREIITEIGKKITKYIKKIDKDYEVYLCGSYRRLKPISQDIDILIVNKNYKKKVNPNKLKEIINYLHKKDLVVDDITYKNPHTKYMGFCKYKNIKIRIDIRLLPYRSLYYGLLYFTGSGSFNQRMRSLAKKFGYKLSEYGLYKKDKFIKVKSEQDIFNILNMPYVPPENRN